MQERKIIALLRERGRAGAARPAGTRWAAVRYVIVPILRDPQEREECLSEVTMRVWEKIDTFQEERGSWNGWLTSLTRHAALNHARRISRHGGAEALSEDPPSPELTPEEVLLRQERQTALGTNLWGLNYLLPGIGLVLMLLGFRLLRREEIEALSSLSISSFDTMELRYYPDEKDADVGESARRYMAGQLAELKGYADEFDRTSPSLVLLGNAGLGKTHAALAIAGEVLEKGFDVIYVSSPDFFSKLEALHFGQDPAGEEETLLRTAAGADLLILDDLGSEFNSSFLISTLYSLLNNRLGAKLPTIVTTNITESALLERLYTEKISSRLASFLPCLFVGKDIRAQKTAES